MGIDPLNHRLAFQARLKLVDLIPARDEDLPGRHSRQRVHQGIRSSENDELVVKITVL